MELSLPKQSTHHIPENNLTFSADFESGNLLKVEPKGNNTFHLWIEADPNSTYRTWFYFSIEGTVQGQTLTFVVVNLSNQVKLFKEGHQPVFKVEGEQPWQRLKIPVSHNGVAKGQQGFQLTFKHSFASPKKHYFAFTYPWTYSECNIFIRGLIQQHSHRLFCNYQPLCRSAKHRQLFLLTLTHTNKKQVQVQTLDGREDLQIYTFKKKKGIFISARVHPGEVAASHILNGLLKYLFSGSPSAQTLLSECVFYVVPMLNPDGVIDGNFRCSSTGKNLNRSYSNPSPVTEPEICGVKELVLSLIHQKVVDFCLDLHAHVNKQGAFVYGNSTSSLKEQVDVCLFPKLFEYNSRYVDYESCNFSEKNMSSKDKGDELSKEGASRVTLFRESGLATCWTLECNYNSARYVNITPKPVQEEPNNKVVSHGVIMEANGPVKKQENRLLNIADFQQIGCDIGETLLDYYHLRTKSPCYNSRLKHITNIKLSLAIAALRMIPFHFDAQCRKLLNNLNSNQLINQTLARILQKLEVDPISQYMSVKELRQRNGNLQVKGRVNSLNSIKNISVSVEKVKVERSKEENRNGRKHEVGSKKALIPDLPKIPRKK